MTILIVITPTPKNEILFSFFKSIGGENIPHFIIRIVNAYNINYGTFFCESYFVWTNEISSILLLILFCRCLAAENFKFSTVSNMVEVCLAIWKKMKSEIMLEPIKAIWKNCVKGFKEPCLEAIDCKEILLKYPDSAFYKYLICQVEPEYEVLCVHVHAQWW